MKTSLWAGLCAAAALALPLAAHAQGRVSAPAASAAAAPTKEQLARGAKEAPAVLAASGARCTLTGAAYRGSSKGKDGKTSDVYEASCQEGLGYLLLTASGGAKPTAYDCLAMQSAPSGGLRCVLPANADPKTGLTRLAETAGRTCQVSNARYIGTSSTSGETFYELACSTGPGFRLGVPAAATAKPDTVDCLTLAGTPQACTLTTKEQSLASLQPLIQASGRSCQVTDGRYIGASEQSHATYYEVACGSGGGFMLAADTATGRFQRAIDCANAQGVGGGCKLTSSEVTAQQQQALFTRGLQSAGFTCQVNRTRVIGEDAQGRSVAEVACSDRPDSVIALFPASGPAEIYDCVQAGALKQTCQFSSPDAIYGKYTAALVAKGRTTCKVSGARYLGESRSFGGQVVETACADGKPGWVVFFRPARPGAQPAVADLRSCGQAAAEGLRCQLPTNKVG